MSRWNSSSSSTSSATLGRQNIGSALEQDGRDGLDELGEPLGLGLELLPALAPSAGRTALAGPFPRPPVRLDPLLPLHPVEGGVERAFLHLDRLAAGIPQPAGDGVPVAGPPAQGAQDEGVEGSVEPVFGEGGIGQSPLEVYVFRQADEPMPSCQGIWPAPISGPGSGAGERDDSFRGATVSATQACCDGPRVRSWRKLTRPSRAIPLPAPPASRKAECDVDSIASRTNGSALPGATRAITDAGGERRRWRSGGARQFTPTPSRRSITPRLPGGNCGAPKGLLPPSPAEPGHWPSRPRSDIFHRLPPLIPATSDHARAARPAPDRSRGPLPPRP